MIKSLSGAIAGRYAVLNLLRDQRDAAGESSKTGLIHNALINVMRELDGLARMFVWALPMNTGMDNIGVGVLGIEPSYTSKAEHTCEDAPELVIRSWGDEDGVLFLLQCGDAYQFACGINNHVIQRAFAAEEKKNERTFH